MESRERITVAWAKATRLLDEVRAILFDCELVLPADVDNDEVEWLRAAGDAMETAARSLDWALAASCEQQASTPAA